MYGCYHLFPNKECAAGFCNQTTSVAPLCPHIYQSNLILISVHRFIYKYLLISKYILYIKVAIYITFCTTVNCNMQTLQMSFLLAMYSTVPSYTFLNSAWKIELSSSFTLSSTIQHSRSFPTVMLQIIMRPTLSYGTESWTTKSNEKTYHEKCILWGMWGTHFWITKETKELRENYRIRIEYGRNCKKYVDWMSSDRINFFNMSQKEK